MTISASSAFVLAGVINLALVLGPQAWGQVEHLSPDFGVPMQPKEAKTALFGIDMAGYSPTAGGMTWRECIDPKGNTLYETPAGVEHGKLRIDESGQACFAYEDTKFQQWDCFSTSRTGSNFRFSHGLDVFITTSVKT